MMIPAYNKKGCTAFLSRRESITGEKPTSSPKKMQPCFNRDSNPNPLGYKQRKDQRFELGIPGDIKPNENNCFPNRKIGGKREVTIETWTLADHGREFNKFESQGVVDNQRFDGRRRGGQSIIDSTIKVVRGIVLSRPDSHVETLYEGQTPSNRLSRSQPGKFKGSRKPRVRRVTVVNQVRVMPDGRIRLKRKSPGDQDNYERNQQGSVERRPVRSKQATAVRPCPYYLRSRVKQPEGVPEDRSRDRN
ncbi:hypothetical protein TNCV_198591 [Trichonephila clavipes]|nr:hypothetical protein TNCV_198591 [Trichonephila clavipes]